MRRELTKWEGNDGFQQYLNYLREGDRHYAIRIKQVLQRDLPTIWSLLRPSFLYDALDLHPFQSMYSRACRYFRSESLRQVFTFASMYMGMSPFTAAGTYSLLQYSELTEGIFYPKGGFHQVVAALVHVGKRFGVRYRLSEPVRSINLTHGSGCCGQRADGVTLALGEIIPADVVIVNADLVYAYNHLLPTSQMSRKLSQRQTSCSSISFYWAMDRQILELATHNIFSPTNTRGLLRRFLMAGERPHIHPSMCMFRPESTTPPLPVTRTLSLFSFHVVT